MTSTTTLPQAILHQLCHVLGIDTHEWVSPAAGRCNSPHGTTHTVQTSSECRSACYMSYQAKEAKYLSLASLNAHIDDINAESDVCRGFAFNSAATTDNCVIYTGTDVVTDTDHDPSWSCVGDIRLDRYKYEPVDASLGCDPNAPANPLPTSTVSTTTKTVTSTSTFTTTSTTVSTTSTSTLPIQTMMLMTLFGLRQRTDSARVFSYPDEVKFQREGMEATMLQLQSSCYEDIDYYMLGGTLPVSEAEWDKLMHLLQDFGESEAWGVADKKCCASATVDRLPVDMEVSSQALSGAPFGYKAKVIFTGLAVGTVSLFGFITSGLLKSIRYKDGIRYPKNPENFCEIVGCIITAVIAAVLTGGLAYLTGLVICSVNSGVAWRMLALGTAHAEGLLLLGPLLSKLCLPVAGAAAGAGFVMWTYPTYRERKAEAPRVITKQLELQYQPITEHDGVVGAKVF